MDCICIHCEESFDSELSPSTRFCGTWCEQSWWMASDAAAEWAKLEGK